MGSPPQDEDSTPWSVRSYYRATSSAAVREARVRIWQLSKETLTVGLLIILLSALLPWVIAPRLLGWPAPDDSLSATLYVLASTLMAVGLLFGLFFTIELVRAPVRMLNEAAEDTATRLAEERDAGEKRLSAKYEAASARLKADLFKRDVQLASWRGTAQQTAAERDEARATIDDLRRQLTPFIELRPLVVEGVERDRNFVRLVVRNPNPKPVPDCQVRLVSIQPRQRPDGGPVPPPGFTFPRSSHEGTALAYPIPPGAPVHVDLLVLEPVPAEPRLYFPSISYERPDTPIRLLFPQVTGMFELELEVNSRTAAMQPTRVRFDVAFVRPSGRLEIWRSAAAPDPPAAEPSPPPTLPA